MAGRGAKPPISAPPRRASRRDGADLIARCGRCGSLDMVSVNDVFCAYCKRKYQPTPSQREEHARFVAAVKNHGCENLASSAPTIRGAAQLLGAGSGATGDQRGGAPRPTGLRPPIATISATKSARKPPELSADGCGRAVADACDSAHTSSASGCLGSVTQVPAAAPIPGPAPRCGKRKAGGLAPVDRGRKHKNVARAGEGASTLAAMPAAADEGVAVVRWAQCDLCESWRIVDGLGAGGGHDVAAWKFFNCSAVGKACGDGDDELPGIGPGTGGLSADEIERRARARSRAAIFWGDVDAHFEPIGPELLAVLRTAGTPEGTLLARRRRGEEAGNGGAGGDVVSAACTVQPAGGPVPLGPSGTPEDDDKASPSHTTSGSHTPSPTPALSQRAKAPVDAPVTMQAGTPPCSRRLRLQFGGKDEAITGAEVMEAFRLQLEVGSLWPLADSVLAEGDGDGLEASADGRTGPGPIVDPLDKRLANLEVGLRCPSARVAGRKLSERHADTHIHTLTHPAGAAPPRGGGERRGP